jgi:predicted nucleotidyltransferase
MTNYRELIRSLVAARVEFIIVGGAAAIAHGASRLTEDLDLVYLRDPKNVEAIIKSLAPFAPYLRGAPAGLPFKWEAQTIWNGLNFTLTTSLGPLDLFAEITLGGTYDDLLPHTVTLDVFDGRCLCLGLERLIQVKHAAGRPKDFDAIAELQALLEERSG